MILICGLLLSLSLIVGGALLVGATLKLIVGILMIVFGFAILGAVAEGGL